MKFKLGDKVINTGKFTYSPVRKGRIVGFVDGADYNRVKALATDFWEHYVPGWRTKPVYFVALSNPSPDVAKKFQQEGFEYPCSEMDAFPEDDLALFDIVNEINTNSIL